MKHAFAVCAYGDSPYLESCLRSLAAQTVPSEILLCTSTPSDYIRALAGKYGVPVLVREGEPGIARDWNFAYRAPDAPLVTLAHQDDMYQREYTRALLDAKEKYPDMSVFMSASITVKDGRLKEYGGIELVKKCLRLPLRCGALNGLAAVKKTALRFGNPVICPSCTYDRTLCGEDLFDPRYRFVLDWDALLKLAEKEGRWICDERPLVLYRVHPDAATGESIRSHVREREEAEMFGRTLPEPAARVIRKLYRKSYDAYKE